MVPISNRCSSYLAAEVLDAAAISMIVPTEQADVKVVLRSLLPTTPEQLQHVAVPSTDLQDTPDDIFLSRVTFLLTVVFLYTPVRLEK